MKPPGFGLYADLEKPLDLGLKRAPPTGLPGPLKLDLGFQPGPAFLSAREAELGYCFALVGRKSDVPSVRGVKGRNEPEAGLPGPKRDFGFQPGPDLLLGRAPPARGLPLLVV